METTHLRETAVKKFYNHLKIRHSDELSYVFLKFVFAVSGKDTRVGGENVYRYYEDRRSANMHIYRGLSRRLM